MPIEFDEQTGESSSNSRLLYANLKKGTKPPAIVVLLIKSHIVKNERGARILLLIVILLILLLSTYLFVSGLSGPVFIDKVR